MLTGYKCGDTEMIERLGNGDEEGGVDSDVGVSDVAGLR